MADYPMLFKPLIIKRMTIKNRIVMSPMGTNFAKLDGSMSDDHLSYYKDRARGGTGLIILENVCLDFPMGSNGTTQLRMDNDQFIPGLYKFTETMHAYGACVSVQINHAGASAYPGRLNGIQPVSASTIPSKSGGAVPRSLTKDEILEIVKKYGEAAHRAQRAGFDCIEIHAGHSYLLSQFLSPVYNQRTDEFGGNPENRSRFTRLVINEVRRQVGPHFPIALRFGAEEFVEGGNTLEDTLELLEFLTDEIDILNVSAALNDSIQYQIDEMSLEDGWRAYMAEAVKKKFNKITVTSGNIRTPGIAEKIIESGQADLIAIGRGLLAEPYWVNKVRYGQEMLMRKCISCNIGCADNRIAQSKPIRCTINPDLIHGDDYKQYQVSRPVRVTVIGGGTAGLEAACTAAEVGCDVHLFEAKSYLGGLAREISRLPDKRRIADFPDYLEKRADRLPNLTVSLNTRADLEAIKQTRPDIVVTASGAKPLLPPIPGLHEELGKNDRHIFSVFDLLADLPKFSLFEGKTIVIVGGGAVGLDVAEYFAKRGAGSVSIIEMLPVLGKDLDLVTRVSMMAMLEKYKVNQHKETALVKVKADHFNVKKGSEETQIPFDYGFICLGMRSFNPLADELGTYCRGNRIESVTIGDSKAARRLINGTREARDILKTIKKVDALKTGSPVAI
ncbi:NAD(P)/FAD-dependent oxidoreductase [Sporolactobacillus pectinivorans]|uniref:NAD(P)/FAD-dependent oxidoreductase n=1 Tax=Sporolactobacillus pectinivorans TaxID=1591408 RepID=UPI0018755035|nr:NAD(P)/FAD-dependent oxidoreductase [Sporolactobacillus pectinivorans]